VPHFDNGNEIVTENLFRKKPSQTGLGKKEEDEPKRGKLSPGLKKKFLILPGRGKADLIKGS